MTQPQSGSSEPVSNSVEPSSFCIWSLKVRWRSDEADRGWFQELIDWTETSCWGLMSSCRPVERRNKINWVQTETAGGRTGESEHNRRQTHGVKQPSWLNLCLKISHVCELTAGSRCGRTTSCTKQMQKQTNSFTAAPNSRGGDQGRGDGQSEINTAPSVTYWATGGPRHACSYLLCGTMINITWTKTEAVCSRERSAHCYK